MTTQKAYRLGTMPRIVLRECRHVNLAKATHESILALVGEWLSLLTELKASPIRDDVKALKTCIEAEKQVRDAQAKYELLKRRYAALKAMGEDAEPPVKPAIVPLPETSSLDLINALVEKAEAASTLEQLPAEICSLYELGILVARCRYDRADDVAAMRIWTIAKGLGCEEWVTGTCGNAGGPVKDLVLSRLDEIDEMFSTQPLPDVEVKAVGTQTAQAAESPYLTIEEAAKILKVGTDTVERLISSGQLPASEISSKGVAAGKKFKRINIDDVHAFMKRSKPVDPVEPRKRRSIKPDQSVKDYFPDR